MSCCTEVHERKGKMRHTPKSSYPLESYRSLQQFIYALHKTNTFRKDHNMSLAYTGDTSNLLE